MMNSNKIKAMQTNTIYYLLKTPKEF